MMNIKSIRFRLAAWYTTAFIVATVIIFTSFYLVTSTTFYRQIDGRLSIHGHKIVEFITNQGIGMHGMISKQAMLQELSDPGMVIAVVDNNGQVLISSLASNQNNGIFSEAFEEATRSPREIYQNRSIAGSTFRLIVIPIWQQGTFSGAAVVGHPIDVIQKSLTSLLITSIGVVLVLIVLSALGGYFLADRGLRPITAISSRLKQIGSENLNDRVPVPATGDELSELATTFNGLLDRLGQAFERERRFIGDLAHELKTPLATLRSSVEVVLSKERTTDEYEQVLSETLLDTNRLTTTLKNVLDLAWSESEDNASGEIFSLSEMVEELTTLTRRLAFPKQISVSGEIEPDIFVKGKQEKMFRAVLNLVDNAIKYTKGKGRIAIRLANDRDNVAQVSIKDTGQGISEHDLPHIFDRFYRGSKTGRALGSGLGLAIAQSIITTYHGRIEVKSKLSKGSEFTILLPVVREV